MTFRFFDLPVSVRQQILQYLVNPFLDSEGRVTIDILNDEECASRRRLAAPDPPTDRWPSHPSRTAHYELDPSVLKVDSNHTHRFSRDLLMLNLARDISQVSPQFRSEFANLFWKRSSINCQDASYKKEFLNFLDDQRRNRADWA
jgi:hypothetical protein